MKNVIELDQVRKQKAPAVPASQLANILSKVIDCIEPQYELKILTIVLSKCSSIHSQDGVKVQASELLEEGKYAPYAYSLPENGAMVIEFAQGPKYILRSAYFLDPEHCEAICVAMDLEVQMNRGKRSRAQLELQESTCID